MFNEFICIFRRYCGLRQQDVADAAGIGIDKYRSIEYGLTDPDKETLNRLTKVFGLKDSVFEMGIEHMRKSFEMFEPKYADDNIFQTAEDKAKVKLMLNMLEEDESRLILLFRTASEKQQANILQTALRHHDEDDMFSLEDLITYNYSCKYNLEHDESALKLEKVFESDDWKNFKAEIKNMIDEKLRSTLDKEFEQQ